MSAVTITCRRTMSRARNLVTTALSVFGFLSATSALFAFRLEAAEGSHQLLSSIWAASISPFLPVLAALLGMDVWSDERRTGRLELLLTVAVKESDFVLGKALGVWFQLLLAVALSLTSTLTTLFFVAPEALIGIRIWMFVPALFVLALQGFLWTAVSVAVSAMCRQAFAAASMTTALLVALPRGLWEAAMNWAPVERTAFGEMPLDAHVIDFSAGVLSTGVVISYVIFSAFALFLTVKIVELVRLPGRRAFGMRLSIYLSVLLAAVASVSSGVLFNRLDLVLDLPVRSFAARRMPRLEHVLAEASGKLTITAFVSRKHSDFRPLAHTLRVLRHLSEFSGGIDVSLRFIDPHWDFGAAERLVRLGVRESSVVFERGHRLVSVPIEDGFGDQILASAIQRTVLPPQRRDIYWTIGHGESSFESYGSWGMSDMARELTRNGYRNRNLDLAVAKSVPQDCALVAVAGAKQMFSRLELERLDGYLRAGGRLLVMTDAVQDSGVGPLLPAWGVKPVARQIASTATLSGSNVLVTEFANHPICLGLTGSRLVFEHPISFRPSAAVEAGGGADRLDFTSIAGVGEAAIIVMVERGSSIGNDIAVRPTRLVVIGDPSFVMNGQLAARANGNRDVFLNVVAFLAGTEQLSAANSEPEALVTGMNRSSRAQFALKTIVIVPLSVFVLMAVAAIRRRRRG